MEKGGAALETPDQFPGPRSEVVPVVARCVSQTDRVFKTWNCVPVQLCTGGDDEKVVSHAKAGLLRYVLTIRRNFPDRILDPPHSFGNVARFATDTFLLGHNAGADQRPNGLIEMLSGGLDDNDVALANALQQARNGDPCCAPTDDYDPV